MSASLFTWLQSAPFYVRLHADAVARVPAASPGARWIDAGCGPGLVARLAADRGYDALGVDRSDAMIEAARRVATRAGSRARFEVNDLDGLRDHAAAEVVSAASLLAVLPDPRAGLAALWSAVRPGGHLLIVEPTEAMGPGRAARALGRAPHPGLLMWSVARAGASVVADVEAFTPRDLARRERVDRLGGMVAIVVLSRAG